MNFRARLLGAVTALTVVTLGGAFVTVSVAVNRDEERQLDRALVLEAREEAREIAQLGGAQLAISDRPGPTANDVGPLTKYAVIYAPNHEVRAATPTFAVPPGRAALGARREGAPFDLAGPGEHLRGVLVAVPGRAGVELLLAAPRTNLDRDAAFLRRAMVLVFVVALGWSLAIASWFLRRLTRDYELIARIAHRAADGDLTARVAIDSPDGDLTQLSHDIDGMIERLSSLVTAQRRFIANAAHELRSPLTALLGEVTLTLRRERSASEYRAALEEALESAERLRALADELLELARLAEAPQRAPDTVDLREVLRAALDANQATARERGVTLGYDEPSEEITLQCRPLELERLVRNLLENAVRHARGRVRVQLSVAPNASRRIEVDDDGDGVAREDVERVFEPFFRGRTTNPSQPGAGLGLAIAREIARGHGGALAIELGEVAARSSRFVVELPPAAPRER